jgi:hypothetical protein
MDAKGRVCFVIRSRGCRVRKEVTRKTRALVVWCLREPEDLPGEGDSHATFASINALCMHQSKRYIRERSKQVSIMGKIFQPANEVVVWLGPEKDACKITVDFVTLHVGVREKSFLSRNT